MSAPETSLTNTLCARGLYDWICENPNAAGMEIERLRAVLAKANDALRAIATKLEGVRADIIPPSVIAIVPLCNELHAAMTGGAVEPSGCPEHGMEHFFEGMCIKCGVVPAAKSGEGQ